MSRRAKDTCGPMSRRASDLSRLGSDKRLIAGYHERLEVLIGLISERDAAISALEYEVRRLTIELQKQTKVVKREHPLEPLIHLVDDKGVGGRGSHMGRTASVATATALRGLGPSRKGDETAQKMLAMFTNPKEHADYLTSPRFAKDLMRLCKGVSHLYEAEPRCVFLQSPVYVFGDIHGNLEDLHFFADNIWKLGMNLTAGKFLFLGDYVDRGLLGLECLAYLFSLKLENPDKLFMLRGNHELRDVNGWVEYYREKSFLWQCQNRFGDLLGEDVWEACNAVFDRMPLAAVIDRDIFCVHGGIPRPLDGSSSRIQDILSVPQVAGVCPPNDLETFESQQVASDCLWSDPAKGDQARPMLNEDAVGPSGFGESLRGGGAICFGAKAIDDFLAQGDLSYIVRAHEAHSEGVSLSKGAKVFTVFSTSKDHGQGRGAMCGCILVNHDKLQVINRSVRYKNRYVHRRDSLSLANITLDEKEKLAKIGVVTDSYDDGADSSSSEDGANDPGEEDVEEDEEDGAAGNTNPGSRASGGRNQFDRSFEDRYSHPVEDERHSSDDGGSKAKKKGGGGGTTSTSTSKSPTGGGGAGQQRRRT
ncbi:unnamed protein product [Ectocarpus sp. 4 AP-2014]